MTNVQTAYAPVELVLSEILFELFKVFNEQSSITSGLIYNFRKKYGILLPDIKISINREFEDNHFEIFINGDRRFSSETGDSKEREVFVTLKIVMEVCSEDIFNAVLEY